MIIGVIAAIINGFCLPSFNFIFGEMVDAFKPTANKKDVLDAAIN